MSIDITSGEPRAPSRAVSAAVSFALVVAWGTIRLVVFDTTMFPLTYAIPLLVCVWTRDRTALWIMAAVFGVFHTIKLFWIIPDDMLAPAELWANYSATLSNIFVAAAAVHAIIRLRERLERTLVQVRAQADELQAQSEELAQQNEELAAQTEELSQQTEELSRQGEEVASQNEELQAQAEEINALNAMLERREGLLQTLLETARLSASERTALQHISAAALELFGEIGVGVAIYEKTPTGLRLRTLTTEDASVDFDDRTPPDDGFVAIVLQENRTAGLSDTSLRPDLPLPALPGLPPVRAVLCAPIHFGQEVFGAFSVYSIREHDWAHEEFRLTEWLADQCGRVLQALWVQSQLRETDQRKSEFLATLSHELRNPLAPIRFALRLMEAETGRNDNAIRIMQRQFQQLVRLVDDLLDATRLSSNKVQIRKTRVDLVPIVQQALEALRPDIEAARHTLAAEFPAKAVWLNADPERIAQVVTNLLNNSIRYTPPGGHITVAVSPAADDVVLSVLDTGVGLDRGDLDRVFEMFTQLGGPGSGGLGIGLALVRGIVELHDGRIEARSEGRGRGSEFRITLPLTDPPSADPVNPIVPSAGAPSRVLIVDDNTDSAEMMGALLETHGHTIRIAHDAEGALAAALEFAPDTALLDIGLPGLDGYELARRLRGDERTRHVRLIALTGWGQEGDRARARDAGFDVHLTKPAEPDVILAALGRAEAT